MQAKKDEKLLKRRNIAPEAELPPLADANQQKVTLFTGVSTMGRGTDILCTVLIRWDKGRGGGQKLRDRNGQKQKQCQQQLTGLIYGQCCLWELWIQRWLIRLDSVAVT